MSTSEGWRKKRDRVNGFIADGKRDLADYVAARRAEHQARPEVQAAVAEVHGATPVSADTIKALRKGDLVRVHRRTHLSWEIVARVNAKTVTLASIPPYDAERVTHDRIVGHQPKEDA